MRLPIEDSCVGTGADGASVNFGAKKGVLTLLGEKKPWMVKVHCVAHRLELALGQAFKGTYFSDTVRILKLK